MKDEYDLSKMKSRPNPYAKKLKKHVTIRMSPDVVEYFKKMAEGQAARLTLSVSPLCKDSERPRWLMCP